MASGHGGCTSFLFGENSEVASLRETLERIKVEVENCMKNLSKGLCSSCTHKPLGCKPRPLQRLAVQPKVQHKIQTKRHFSRAEKGKAKVGSHSAQPLSRLNPDPHQLRLGSLNPKTTFGPSTLEPYPSNPMPSLNTA